MAVSDEQSRQQDIQATNNFDFVATQVGLLASRSVAERTAQDLNLPNNPDVVGQEGASSQRLRGATAIVQQGLHVIAPEDGQLIRFSYDFNLTAARCADRQRHRRTASSTPRCSGDTRLRPTPATSSSGRSTRPAAISRNPNGRSLLTRSSKASSRPAAAAAAPTGIRPATTPIPCRANRWSNSTARWLRPLPAGLPPRVPIARRLQSGPPARSTTASCRSVQELAKLQGEYQQKRAFMKPEHPEMVSLQSQITELQKQIGAQVSQASTGRINGLLADYKGALAAEQSLQAKVSRLKGDVLNLRGRSIQYTILQREVDTNRSLYDALLQRYKQIGVAGGVGMAPVSVVDRAQAPTLPFKPNLFLNILMGLGLGLVAGIAGAIGLEFANDTIKTREDVRRKLALACLGTVPRTAARGSFVDDLKNPTSIISEAYSAIVAALRFSTDEGMPRVLLVTSTRSGEGKSSSALAIAQNAARRERRVLLVDSDLRKPAFKASNERVGLSKLLTTDDPVSEHVVETQHENLWLLPSGPLPPNPADLLSTGRIRKIVSEARESFDLVVIDGPPTLGLAGRTASRLSSGERLVRHRKRQDPNPGRDRGLEPSRSHRHPDSRRDADQVCGKRQRIRPLRLRLWLRLRHQGTAQQDRNSDDSAWRRQWPRL